MIKKERYIAGYMDQDTAPDKRDNSSYWDAENIRIVNNGRVLSVKPVNGNLLFVPIPVASANLYYVGSVELHDMLYVFLSDNNGPIGASTDTICEISRDGTATVLVTGSFNLSGAHRVEIIGNYENENVVKLYWVDGINQLRVLNVKGDMSLITEGNDIDVVKVVNFSKPSVNTIIGGSLLAGKVQYAYSLFNRNGAETVISPLSDLISIVDKDNTPYFGGEAEEVMNVSVRILINPIDTYFEFIRIYSIHYQEYNQTPKITLIIEEAITDSVLAFTDDGNTFIAEYGLNQFLFLGAAPTFPNAIASKYNRLFVSNYRSNFFDIPDTEEYDCRVFAHSNVPEIGLQDTTGTSLIVPLPSDVPMVHDAINLDTTIYKFQNDGVTLGATGRLFEVEFLSGGGEQGRLFKNKETYRIGVVFFNKYGQASPAHWMIDIYAENITHLNAVLLDTTLYENAGVVAYQLVAVERKEWDKTIVAQGFIVPSVMYEDTKTGEDVSGLVFPQYIAQTIQSAGSTEGGNIAKSYEPDVDWHSLGSSDTADGAKPAVGNSTVFFYSPEVLFNDNTSPTTKIRICNVALSIMDSVDHSGFRAILYEDYLANQLALMTNRYETNWGGGTYPQHIMDANQNSASSIHLNNEFIGQLNFEDLLPSDVIIDIDVVSMVKVKQGEASILENDQVSNAIDIETVGEVSGYPSTSLAGIYANSIAIKFSSPEWHKPSSGDSDYAYFKSLPADANYRYLPVIELIREVTNQYGGNSYEAKKRNVYSIKGAYVTLDTNYTSYHSLGDIYTNQIFRINRTNGEGNQTHNVWNLYEIITVVGLETTINLNGRNDDMHKNWNSISSSTEYRHYMMQDNHKLLRAYNQQVSPISYTPVPVTFMNVSEFSNRIIASEVKYNGELIDNWAKFLPNEFIDVDGIYGAVNKLHIFNGEMLAFQDTAISQIAVQPRVQVTDQEGVGIYLGTGKVLHDYTYLTTKSGTKNKFTVVDDGKLLMYYDTIMNTLSTIDGTKVSTALGIKAIIDVQGINLIEAVYDNNNDEFIFNFGTFVLAFDLITTKFISRRTFDSYEAFMPLDKFLLYLDLQNNNIIKAYGGASVVASSITYIFAPDYGYEKVFHNIEYRMIGEDFDTIEVENQRNSSGEVALVVKNKFDLRRAHLPRVEGTIERFRGTYVLVRLKANFEFALDDMVIMYNLKG